MIDTLKAQHERAERDRKLYVRALMGHGPISKRSQEIFESMRLARQEPLAHVCVAAAFDEYVAAQLCTCPDKAKGEHFNECPTIV